MKSMPYFQGTGSRKTSVARVRLVPGEGTVVVNGKPLEEYFGGDGYSESAVQAFTVTDTARRFNAMVKVSGGGESGRLGAIRNAIDRGPLDVDADHHAVVRNPELHRADPPPKVVAEAGAEQQP